MESLEITFIIFGSSGLIVLILIVVFKWMNITCTKKSNLYKVEDDNQSNRKDKNTKRKQNFDQIYDIDDTKSDITNASCEKKTTDFSNIYISTDSLITQTKPKLRSTIKCNYNYFDEESFFNENQLNNSRLEVEINYNAFEEYLEVKVIQAKDLLNDYLKANNIVNKTASKSESINYDNSSLNDNENIQLYTRNKVYFIIWLNDDSDGSQKSQIKRLSNSIAFNNIFRWLIDDSSIMKIQINMIVYLIEFQSGIESILSQSCIKVGDVYMYQPVGLWLSLQDPDEQPSYNGEILVSLSYLPTAERLSVVVVEARNLQFENNFAFGDSFVKISLVRVKENKIESCKTSVRKSNPNPQFNEVSVFKLSSLDIDKVYLKLTIYELENDKSKRIGHVNIGPQINKDSTSISHWQQILKQVRRKISIWHPIQK